MQVTVGISGHNETIRSHVLEECVDLIGIFSRQIFGIQNSSDHIPFAEASCIVPLEDLRVLPFQALNKSLGDGPMLRNAFKIRPPLKVPVARPDVIEDEVEIVVQFALNALRIDPNDLGGIGHGAEAASVAPEKGGFSPYDPEPMQSIVVLREDELTPRAGETVKDVARTRV